MTPQEKAKELVDKFYGEHPTQPPRMKGSTSIICALIAVDEIKEVVSKSIPYKSEDSYIEYWQQVKQEISLL